MNYGNSKPGTIKPQDEGDEDEKVYEHLLKKLRVLCKCDILPTSHTILTLKPGVLITKSFPHHKYEFSWRLQSTFVSQIWRGLEAPQL
jgi:hypothetical protein